MVIEPGSKDERETQDTTDAHERYGTDCYIFLRGATQITI